MGEDYDNKRIRKANQKYKLLINRDDFQIAISDLRKKWDIPLSGFDDDKSYLTWREKLEKRMNDHSLARPSNKFINEIIELTNKFNIYSDVWRDLVIRPYLIFGDRAKITLPFGNTRLSSNVDIFTGKKEVTITFYEDTTLEDIKNAFKEGKLIMNHTFGEKRRKSQPIKNLELYKRSYDLRLRGNTYRTIADILSAETEQSFTYVDIMDFVKKYKNHMGID